MGECQVTLAISGISCTWKTQSCSEISHHIRDIVNNRVAIFKMADRAVRPAGTTAKPQEEGGGKVHSFRN
jgi:hypothetical protein